MATKMPAPEITQCRRGRAQNDIDALGI